MKYQIIKESFGTSGSRRTAILLNSKGVPYKGKNYTEYRYWYNPSANAGRGAVIENTIPVGMHFRDDDGKDICYEMTGEECYEE